MALQDKHDTKLIIYMNIKTNIMTLELTNRQVSLLQDLIYNEIDRCGGVDNLSDDIEAILTEIREKKTLKAL